LDVAVRRASGLVALVAIAFYPTGAESPNHSMIDLCRVSTSSGGSGCSAANRAPTCGLLTSVDVGLDAFE
jgi:hypothetical protein